MTVFVTYSFTASGSRLFWHEWYLNLLCFECRCQNLNFTTDTRFEILTVDIRDNIAMQLRKFNFSVKDISQREIDVALSL
jgi:hypothetical protein